MKKDAEFSRRGLRFRATGFLLVMMAVQLPFWAAPPAAQAKCVTTGQNIVCDGNSPQQDPNGVQLGPNGDGYNIVVQSDGRISTGRRSAISVGSNNEIAINWDIENYATDSPGLYGQRANTIEGDALNEITINSGGEVLAKGSDADAAAIKMMGHGNVITNRGLINARRGAAVWFQNGLVAGPELNRLINHGTISISSEAAAGIAIGSNDGVGVILDNYGTIVGGVSFGNGDDSLTFYDGSRLTGNVSAGGGNNNLTFNSGSTLAGNITTGDGNDAFTLNHNITFSGNIDAGRGQNTLTLIAGTTNEVDYLNGNLTGLTNIVKQGLGSWTLHGDLIGTKNVTVEQGWLTLDGRATGFYGQAVIEASAILSAHAASLPVKDPNDPTSTTPQIKNDGTLFLSDSNGGEESYSGLISGSGNIVKSGTGTVLLLGDNTYTGDTTISQGTLALAGDKALGDVDSILNFQGGTLKFAAGFDLDANRSLRMETGSGGTIDTNSFDITLNQLIVGQGSLTKTGEGSLTLPKTYNSHLGGTIINEGTVVITTDRNLGDAAGGLTFGDNGTLRLDANNIVLAATRTVTVNGTGAIDTRNQTGSQVASTIVGNGTLIKKGDGSLLLSGTNTFSGTTEIEAGELRAGSSGAFSANSHFKVDTGGALNLNNSNQSIGGLEGEGTVLLGSNKLTINQASDSTFSGTLSGTTGTLSKTGAGGLMLASALASGLNLEVNGASGYLGLQRNGNLDLQNKLTGNGTLLVDLAGNDLTLDQAGVGTNFEGTLDLQNTNLALGSEEAAVLAKAALELSENSTAQLDDDRTIGGLVFDGGTLNVDDHTLTVDNLTLKSGGTVQLDAGALSGSIDPNQNIFDYADGAAQIAVVLAGNVTGQTGQLNVRDENGDPIDQGTEKDISGGKIYFNVTASVENSVTQKGVYVGYGPTKVEAYAGQTVTLDSTSASSSDPRLTAQLTGAGGFIFTGNQDVLVGSSTSDYTGATTIDGLQVTTTTDKAFGHTSLLNLINNGSVDLDGRRLSVGGLSGESGTGIIMGTFNSPGGLTVNQAGDRTYSGNLTGYGDFTKDGAGQLVLDGGNSYVGATTVKQGTLVAGSANAFTQNQAWKIDGGQVDLNGYDLVVSQFSGRGGELMLTDQAGLTVNQADDTTYRGVVSGTGSLTKNGSGNLTLGGRNSYVGGTFLNSGSLTAGAAGVFSSASVHVLDGSSVLNLGGFNQTVAGLRGGSADAQVALTSEAVLTIDAAADHLYEGSITGSGSLVKNGAGQQELGNANNNFTGGLDIKEGAVKLATAKAAGSGDLIVRANAGLIVDNSANESMSNAISGRGTLIKSNSGNLALQNKVDLGTIDVRGGLMSLADTLAADKIIIAAGSGLDTETLLFRGNRTLDLTGAQGSFSYNRMEVRGRNNQVVGDLPSAAGQDLHFVLPAGIKAGEVMLGLTGQALNIADAKLSLAADGYLRELIGGDQIILIDKTTGTIAGAGQTYQALYGATAYNFAVDQSSDQLAINYQGRAGDTSKAKSYLEAPLAGLALTADHGRQVVDLASRQIIDRTENGVGVLAGLSASHNRVDTGSHADIDGFSYMAGPAWRFDNLSGVSRVGVFVEGGSGDYDAFNRTSDRRIKGSGDIDHLGGVLFGRHDFQDNYYLEGSFRLGRVETDYKTSDLGTRASFDSSALYWGAHVGGGYLYSLDEQSLVQPYLNVYFTRQNSDDVTTQAGERVKLDTADSVVTRLGARYSRAFTETITARVGAAWDQELDGEQGGTIDGLKIPNPSMKGASAFGEIGLSFQPKDAPYYVEVNAFGNAGKRDGGGGQAAVGVNF